jgi:KDO2-lipid IV(A) lauroyltransferase
VMYRFNKNPAWEWLQVQGRKRFFDGVIEREDTRQTLRRLKRGRVIWYAADQDYGRKHSVFAPFFGIPAATIVATSRFARLNNSPVLLMRQTRDRKNRRWQIHFSPVIENFPSGDDAADAKRMNNLLEEQIRLHPEQYLWLHKRFKTRPPGEPAFYPDGA